VETIDGTGRTFTFVASASSWAFAWVRSASVRTGKRYWEVVNTGPAVVNFHAGVVAQSTWTASGGGFYPGSGYTAGVYVAAYGTVGGGTTGYIDNGVPIGNGGYTWTAGQVCGVACDFDAGKIWFSRTGAFLAGNPAAGTGQTMTFAASGAFDPYVGFYQLGGATQVLTCNFNEADLAFAPPSGFLVLP
jgi:hypothetical protein